MYPRHFLCIYNHTDTLLKTDTDTKTLLYNLLFLKKFTISLTSFHLSLILRSFFAKDVWLIRSQKSSPAVLTSGESPKSKQSGDKSQLVNSSVLGPDGKKGRHCSGKRLSRISSLTSARGCQRPPAPRSPLLPKVTGLMGQHRPSSHPPGLPVQNPTPAPSPL